MKKIAVGGWAFELYPEELYKTLREIGFDGVSLGCFKPYGIWREAHDTPQKRKLVKAWLLQAGLEVPEYSIDLYGSNALTEPETWFAQYCENVDFLKSLDITDTIRVDTGIPAALPRGYEYGQVKDYYKKTFKKMAKKAGKEGFRVVWEFEPGFIVNEPANVVEIVKDVDEPNFLLEFDTCHANNCANGVGHIEPGMALSGGIMEFIHMCRGFIGQVHLIDSDGSVVKTGIDIVDNAGEPVELVTSAHVAFGKGYLDFDKIILALLQNADYTGGWWVIDMELNPLEYAYAALDYVKALNKKYC